MPGAPHRMTYDPDYFSGDDGGFWHEPDFLLTTLVSLLANKIDVQLGITLLVRGAIITGALVGETEYLDRLDSLFKETTQAAFVTPSKEDLAILEEALQFQALYEDSYPRQDETDDAGAPIKDGLLNVGDIRHLHIKDPVIVYPGTALSFIDSPLPIMRIKLTAVDGWLLGRMNLIGPDDLTDIPDMGIRH